MAVRAERHRMGPKHEIGGAVLALLMGSLLPVATIAEPVLLDTLVIHAGRDDDEGGKLPKTATGGTKTETPLVEVPQSVSVVTETAIRESRANTIGQALAYSPGLFANPGGGNDSARYDFPSLRGQSYNGALFLDGMRGSFGVGNLSLPQFDPFTLERIEVIRGPSSVLYGQGLPGGIVNAITKRPIGDRHRELAFTLGTENRREMRFDFGGSSGNGVLDFRLAGLARAADNRIDHVSEERLVIAPSLRWNIADGTSLTFLGSYQYDPKGGYYGSMPPEGLLKPLPDGRYIPRDFSAGEPSFDMFTRKQAVLGYSFEHEFANTWKLRQDLRFIDSDVDVQAVSATMLMPPATLARSALYGASRTEALMIDTAIEGAVDTGAARHRLLFGVDYMQSKIDQQIGTDMLAVPPIDIWNPVYGGTIPAPDSPAAMLWSSTLDEVRQYGIYAQDQIEYGRFLFTLGARYDIAETDSTRDSYLMGTPTGGASRQRDEAFSGRAAMSYRFDEGLVGYLSYATSFLPQAGMDAAGDGYRPLQAGQWETGLKFAPEDGTFAFSAALFDIRQKNALTPDPNPANICIGMAGPGPCMVQTGEQRTRGLELEAKAELAETTFLHASLTWLDAEITASNGPDLGKRPVNIPRTITSLWLDHELQSGLKLGLGVRHVGATYADAANAIRVGSHTLVDAAVSYDLTPHMPAGRDAALTLRATNLFDRSYVSCSATTYCNYGEGRKVSAELSYKW